MLNQHYGVVLYGNNRFLNTDFGFLNCKKKYFMFIQHLVITCKFVFLRR